MVGRPRGRAAARKPDRLGVVSGDGDDSARSADGSRAAAADAAPRSQDGSFITGWRSRSEVLPLTWAQIDFAGGFVRLEPGTTKNKDGRAFPLIPELRALLERRQAVTRRCERAQARIIARVFHERAGISRSSR